MSDLEVKFKTSAEEAQNLSRKPDNDTLLNLYSLYKQATRGDVSGKRPGFTDMVGRAKYDAWSKLKGMSQEQAMRNYIELVEKLKRQ